MAGAGAGFLNEGVGGLKWNLLVETNPTSTSYGTPQSDQLDIHGQHRHINTTNHYSTVQSNIWTAHNYTC